MATLSATFFWAGFRHPVRTLKKQLSRHAPPASDAFDQSAGERSVRDYGAQSSERLERIAAYARCGYFHMEYTAGMFVVPLEMPPQ
ncbi:hypothetical protein [Paraburkholderia aromaticivorans]|uniref:Uncharacterized protein n=1 Tax=Paraburkholderia aromaticivorans TaxID=2026199 RepID=A0A248VQS4_9BURK|nr:hypothetical protein [Paraburkholderia aromaticivorans]ASW00872.1 hypothetical protein CJU94_21820 [Paraburkholderia aromaticivorans]